MADTGCWDNGSFVSIMLLECFISQSYEPSRWILRHDFDSELIEVNAFWFQFAIENIGVKYIRIFEEYYL